MKTIVCRAKDSIMCNYKYLNKYINLIDSRSYRHIDREIGYEIHHIVPRSWGGENLPYNKVKLTYREHYIAHKLLHKAYPEDKHMAYALLCMVRDPYGHRNLTGLQIQSIKRSFSIYRTGKRYPDSHMKLQLHRERQSNLISGNNNPLRKFPEKNHTAKPVKVTYEDNSVITYKYLKEITILTGVPYNTLKYCIQRNIGSKKHKILKMEKVCA